jgi:hypothetical protein
VVGAHPPTENTFIHTSRHRSLAENDTTCRVRAHKDTAQHRPRQRGWDKGGGGSECHRGLTVDRRGRLPHGSRAERCRTASTRGGGDATADGRAQGGSNESWHLSERIGTTPTPFPPIPPSHFQPAAARVQHSHRARGGRRRIRRPIPSRQPRHTGRQGARGQRGQLVAAPRPVATPTAAALPGPRHRRRQTATVRGRERSGGRGIWRRPWRRGVRLQADRGEGSHGGHTHPHHQLQLAEQMSQGGGPGLRAPTRRPGHLRTATLPVGAGHTVRRWRRRRQGRRIGIATGIGIATRIGMATGSGIATDADSKAPCGCTIAVATAATKAGATATTIAAAPTAAAAIASCRGAYPSATPLGPQPDRTPTLASCWRAYPGARAIDSGRARARASTRAIACANARAHASVTARACAVPRGLRSTADVAVQVAVAGAARQCARRPTRPSRRGARRQALPRGRARAEHAGEGGRPRCIACRTSGTRGGGSEGQRGLRRNRQESRQACERVSRERVSAVHSVHGTYARTTLERSRGTTSARDMVQQGHGEGEGARSYKVAPSACPPSSTPSHTETGRVPSPNSSTTLRLGSRHTNPPPLPLLRLLRRVEARRAATAASARADGVEEGVRAPSPFSPGVTGSRSRGHAARRHTSTHAGTRKHEAPTSCSGKDDHTREAGALPVVHKRPCRCEGYHGHAEGPSRTMHRRRGGGWRRASNCAGGADTSPGAHFTASTTSSTAGATNTSATFSTLGGGTRVAGAAGAEPQGRREGGGANLGARHLVACTPCTHALYTHSRSRTHRMSRTHAARQASLAGRSRGGALLP